ncbi:mono/diheme cytochrome c family protein [Pacificibacter maritimus]|uniref:Mono/diheme cytochrome c family protein n=1 Tax=Pacificibacter maritimus TaxID=762213 RepID=A0A3N4V2R3_9RHOB|nr:cytochrome c [Pacificibacter maritimus]RPE71387.1 mono/diheme cytochrome c family protein [Pacificibacter maritimus]
MRKSFVYLFGTAILGAAVAWVLTEPRKIDDALIAGITPDVDRGKFVYTAAGCASCHAGVDGTADSLSGGMSFPSEFGTFYAPNISSSKDQGIGAWSATDLANALLHGSSPEGQHYYPAFPYTSYAKMTPSDVVSLHGYLQTLPASDQPSQAHDVGFPFNIRRSLGGWKLLFGSHATDWVVTDPNMTEEDLNGRYLVEALAHCGECHTPRNALGGLDNSKHLGGAPNPSGRGMIPNITPGTLTWTEEEIAYYFESGFTPDFDSAGGHMAHVVENFAQLAPSDREAVAAYLKRVTPVQ